MAEEAKDDELKEAADAGKAKSKSGIIKIALIVVGAVLLLGVNAAITVMLVGGHKSEQAASGPEPGKMEAAEGGHGAPEGHGEGKKDAAKGGSGAPIYYKIDPTFVVNFQAQDALRFLQVTVELMARDQSIVAAIEQHLPIIRNNLILLFSSQDFTTISTRVGKERLRAQVLAEVQRILKEQTGKPGVEAVFFTSFVMQ